MSLELSKMVAIEMGFIPNEQNTAKTKQIIAKTKQIIAKTKPRLINLK